MTTSGQFLVEVATVARASIHVSARVQRGLALEPRFRSRMFSELGIATRIADKFVEGARLLELPE